MNFPADDFRKAQLGATDLAKLFQVSRTTTSRWLERGPVHAMAEASVQRRHRAVLRALETGSLPLKAPQRGPGRADKIRAILAGR